MVSHYTLELVTTLYYFGSVLRWPLETLLGLSQFYEHGSWLLCEVPLSVRAHQLQNWLSIYHMAVRPLKDFHGHGSWSVY